MKPDETARVGKGTRNILELERRGVGGEHGARLHLLLKLGEQLLLDVEPLDDRLDHDVGMVHIFALGVGDEARDRRIDRELGAEMALEQALGAGESLGDLRLVEILKARLHALHHAPGGDVSAHGSGADHMNAAGLKSIFRRIVLQHLRQLEHAAQIA